MSNNEIILNFYDEEIKIKIPNKYSNFKKLISEQYLLDPSDTEELVVYFFDSSKSKHYVKNNNDFLSLQAATKQKQITVYLDIHEDSKLFKNENKNLISNNNENDNNDKNDKNDNNNNNDNNDNNDKNYNNNDIIIKSKDNNQIKDNDINAKIINDAEKLKKEILEKENMLKEIIEKEKKEMLRKKEEVKKQAELSNLKKTIEEFKKKKALIEKENESKKKKEKEDLENEVSNLIINNFEKIKESLIKDTINESIVLVDKQFQKRSELSINKEVHVDFECCSCNIKPIVGIRYMCPNKNNINFCESCELLIGEEYSLPLLKIRNNKQFDEYNELFCNKSK